MTRNKNESSLTEGMLNPKSDEDFFAIGRWIRERCSTCPKTQTGALIVDAKGKSLSHGANMCCPQGQLYGMPVSECPREKIKTGGRYELCKPIHAEIVACINALGISVVEQKHLWHFPGFTLRLKRYEGFFAGARLYLVGHYWACEECTEFSKLIGIEEIKFDDISGSETLKRYSAGHLTAKERGALDVSGAILRGVVTVQISSGHLEEFRRRNQLKRRAITPFLRTIKTLPKDMFVIEVPPGEEQVYAERFKKDPAVRRVELLRETPL